MLWLPPGCKAGNPKGNGYDIYDLWDLGEFDWKGQRPTKWGCKEELEALCAEARRLEVGVLWDAVLNHRVAADFSEELHGIKVDGDGTLTPTDLSPHSHVLTGIQTDRKKSESQDKLRLGRASTSQHEMGSTRNLSCELSILMRLTGMIR